MLGLASYAVAAMVEGSPLHHQVAHHYSKSTGGDLLGSVLAALEVAGIDVSGELRYEDMRGVDHFHGGALAATRTLAKLAELTAGQQVLDIGGGFGGPARTLAAEFGCKVTVLDPTERIHRKSRARRGILVISQLRQRPPPSLALLTH